jgi:hypothetical protein
MPTVLVFVRFRPRQLFLFHLPNRKRKPPKTLISFRGGRAARRHARGLPHGQQRLKSQTWTLNLYAKIPKRPRRKNTRVRSGAAENQSSKRRKVSCETPDVKNSQNVAYSK